MTERCADQFDLRGATGVGLEVLCNRAAGHQGEHCNFNDNGALSWGGTERCADRFDLNALAAQAIRDANTPAVWKASCPFIPAHAYAEAAVKAVRPHIEAQALRRMAESPELPAGSRAWLRVEADQIEAQ